MIKDNFLLHFNEPTWLAGKLGYGGWMRPPWFWHLHGAPGRPIWTISDIQKLFCLLVADWIRPIQMAQSIKPMLRYWILENHAIYLTPWGQSSPRISAPPVGASRSSRWHRKRGPQTYFERLKKVVHGHVSFGNHLAKCPKPEKLGHRAAPNPVYTSFSGGHSLPTSSGEPWTACCKTYSSAKMGFDLGEPREVRAAWGKSCSSRYESQWTIENDDCNNYENRTHNKSQQSDKLSCALITTITIFPITMNYNEVWCL